MMTYWEALIAKRIMNEIVVPKITPKMDMNPH
jgi:hypothetical protein